MLIIYGSSCEALARSIAKEAGFPVLEVSRRRFPDGEQYVKINGDVLGKDVAVVQSLGLNPDPLLIEYSLLVDALKGSGCKSVTGVIPYLAYARQDSRFHGVEPLSAKLIPKFIEAAGTDKFVTVDMHLHRFKYIGEVFDIPAVNVSAMPLLADYYKKKIGSAKALVIGPDMESEQWARVVAERITADYTILKKERHGDREVCISVDLSLKGKKILLVDDMISTGKTLMGIISNLKAQGIERVDALVTHALLVEDALAILKKSGLSELIFTDTVPGRKAHVSVAPLIAKVLKG
jgi:ribose-phosphate pyrophosphokinase